MAFTEISDSDLAPPGFKEISDADLTPPEATPSAPAPETRSFLQRGWDSLKQHVSEVPATASKAIDAAGSMATNALDTATAGGYKTLRDLPTIAGNLAHGNIKKAIFGDQDATPDAITQTTRDWNAEHPFAAGVSNGVGYLAGAPEALAQAGAAGVKAGAEAAPAAIRSFLAARPVAGAITGGVTGGATQLAEDVGSGAPLDTDLLKRAGQGAAVGAALGGVGGSVSAIKDKVFDGSPGKARARILSDIQGDNAGYSTRTARIQAIRRDGDIADLVMQDPKLETELLKAKTNDVGHLSKAIDTIQDRLDVEGAPRKSYYQDFDQTLAAQQAPIRSGDYIDHLESEAKKLDATGDIPDRKIAAQLRREIETKKTASDWGYKPEAPEAKDPEYAGTLKNLVAKRAQIVDAGGAVPASLDSVIEQISKPQESYFDPNHIVSSLQVRRSVTAMQKAAESAEGGLHGTPNYELGREVASRGEDFLRGLKQEVSASNPELITKLNEHDQKVSALLHLKTVLDQRLASAKLAGMGSEGDDMFGRALHTVAKGKHGVIRAVESELANKAILAKRAGERASRPGYDQAVNRLADLARTTPTNQFIAAAVRAGLPPADAKRISDEAQKSRMAATP